MARTAREEAQKNIAENRKAFHDYHIIESFEAGIVLVGTEVKAIREARVNLRDSFGRIEGGEVFVLNIHISPYSHRGSADHEPMRKRKLLLHKQEIRKLIGKTVEKGLTLVATKMYFKNGKAKVSLGLCRGKTHEDRRQTIKEREQKRELNERKAARDTGKYKEIEQYQYSNEEHDRIDQIVLDEPKNIRGANVRYWEEVEIGEELPTIARGPLSLMDTMGFLVGCGRGHTHGVVLQAAVKHPGHFFRNPEAGGGVEYTGIGHHRESVAKEVGVPGTYDYGPQRSSWMATLITNWMGDDGFLRKSKCQVRRHNPDGDAIFINGTVVRKFVEDGKHLVEISQLAETHRGETSATGVAIVELPSRAK